MAFEVFKSEKTEKFHIRLRAKNGQIVFSGQGYAQKSGAQNGINSIIKNTADGDGNFEVLTAKDNCPYFVLKAKNGEIIGKSQMYKSTSSMKKGMQSVIKNAQEGQIKDLC